MVELSIGMDYMIPNYTEELQKNHDKNDVVARWLLPIRGKLYDVELEHGKISGKRVIWVNGEVSIDIELKIEFNDFNPNSNL